MFVACDESGVGGEKHSYIFLGSLWMPKYRIGEFEKFVFECRMKHNVWKEMRWERMQKQPSLKKEKIFRTNVVDYVLTSSDVSFKSLVLPKKKLGLKNTHEERLRFLNLLLSRRWTKEFKEGENVYVLVDEFELDSYTQEKGGIKESYRYLKNYLEQNKSVSLDFYDFCDSRQSAALQMTDLLLGAVKDKWTKEGKDINDNRHEVITHVEQALNQDIQIPTPTTNQKFNIWYFDPKYA